MAPPGIGSDPLADHPKYEKVKDLAAGAFGFVQLARNRATGRHVAIKFLPRGERIGRVSLLDLEEEGRREKRERKRRKRKSQGIDG
jgi:serine/threonine protein kinase